MQSHVDYFPANESHAKLWMIDNQNGRRNLTDGWKYQLTQSKKEILLAVGKDNLKIPTGGKNSMTLSTIDNVKHNTRDTIANDLGWSTGKVAMADKVLLRINHKITTRINV